MYTQHVHYFMYSFISNLSVFLILDFILELEGQDKDSPLYIFISLICSPNGAK